MGQPGERRLPADVEDLCASFAGESDGVGIRRAFANGRRVQFLLGKFYTAATIRELSRAQRSFVVFKRLTFPMTKNIRRAEGAARRISAAGDQPGPASPDLFVAQLEVGVYAALLMWL